MKLKHFGILLVFVGVVLIGAGILRGVVNIYQKQSKAVPKKEYLKAPGNIKGIASFMEKDNKFYVQVDYENITNQEVKLKKVKLLITKTTGDEKYYEKEISVNKIIPSLKKNTIKFTDIPGDVGKMKDYYAEVFFK